MTSQCFGGTLCCGEFGQGVFDIHARLDLDVLQEQKRKCEDEKLNERAQAQNDVIKDRV